MRCYFKVLGSHRLTGILFLILSLFKVNTALAAEEPYVNSLRGVGVVQGGKFDVTDEKFLSPTIFYGKIKSAPYSLLPENIVELKLNYDTSAYFYDKKFTATVNVTILCYNNPYDTSQVFTQYNNVNLSITHDTVSGAPYKGLYFMKFSGAYKFRVIINSITCPELGANMPKVLIVEGKTVIKRKYNFSATTSDITKIEELPNQVKLSWVPANYAGAESFDLEYTVVDDSSAAAANLRSYLSAGTPVPQATMEGLFRNNASRITTSGSSYTLNLLYQAGYLIFRLRGVQFVNEYQANLSAAEQNLRTEGNWNYLASKVSQPSYQYNIVQLEWHEPNLNWQYSVSFAEEGKRKEVIGYFDGIFKNHQNVTLNNSDNKTVVQETVYDALGRGAISILPAPANDSTLHYFANFNQNSAGKGYSYKDFAFGATCRTIPSQMSNTSGANKYYSANNDVNDYFFKKYIPQAEGYPFAVTEFTPDNTGRIFAQSGVGKEFQPGSNHETKYYYSKPTQEELDRLFGSEAGNASHYLKNMVVDPNGQISVSYLNASGKTVATALAGLTPTNVQALGSNNGAGTDVAKQLLKPQDFIRDDAAGLLLGNSSFLAAVSGNYKFKYSFTPQRLDVLHGSASQFKVCNTCYYDVEVLVKDNCNQVLKTISKAVDPATLFQTNCSVNPVQIADSFNLTINTIGEYSVSYSLKVSENAIHYYDSINLVQNTNILPYNSFVLDKLNQADFKGCFSDCATCIAELGTKADFINHKVKPLFVQADSMVFAAGFNTWAGALYDSLLANCNSIQSECMVTTPCDEEKQLLLADVKPGGQYSPYDSITYQPTEVFINVMRNIRKYVTFLNEDGSVGMIEVNGTLYNANDTVHVPWQAFIENFRDSWAEALLPYHPEYCFYQWCLYGTNPASKSFDLEITDMADDSIATAKGYFGTVTSLLNNDPFFKSTGSGYSFYSKMLDSLNYFSRTTPGYNGPDMNIKQYVDYELYCQPDGVLPGNCTPPAANATCRSSYVEWQLYRDYYLNLKTYFNEKARLANPSFANCRNCYIGGDHTNFLGDTLTRGLSRVQAGKLSQAPQQNGGMVINAIPGCGCPATSAFTASIYTGTCSGNGARFQVNYSGPSIPAGRTVYVDVYWFDYSTNTYGVTTVTFTTGITSVIGCTGALSLQKSDGVIGEGQHKLPNALSLNKTEPLRDSLLKISRSPDSTQLKAMLVLPPGDYDFSIQSVYCYDAPGSACNPAIPEPVSLCPSDPLYPYYKDKIRRYDSYQNAQNFYNDMTANYNNYKNQEQTHLSNVLQSNCEAQADVWINALRKCTPDEGILASIRAGLIAVCKSGCDSSHLYGASTNPALTQSFESVIRQYIPNASDSCTAELISDPYPYNKQPSTDNRTVIMVDSCLAARYAQLKAQYLGSGYAGTFHQWLQKQLKNDYRLTAQELDSLGASIANGCRYLKKPLLMPAAFNCSSTAACVDSAITMQTYYAFLAKYPGITSSNTNYEVLLTNYFNHTLGFMLNFDDYRQYISKCQAGSTNKDLLCNVGQAYYDDGATNVSSCMAETFNLAISQAVAEYTVYIDSVRAAFRSSYIAKCMAAAPGLVMNVKLYEYHYTLYYYDQSGNLVKTIPPAGVNILTEAEVAQVNANRMNTNNYCYTSAPELNFNNNIFTMKRDTTYDPVIDGKYTLEVWLKLNNLPISGPNGVLSYNDRYSPNLSFAKGFSLLINGNKLLFSAGNDMQFKLKVESPLLSSLVSAGNWFHLAITVDNNAAKPVKMYVNGSEIQLTYLNNYSPIFTIYSSDVHQLKIGAAFENGLGTTSVTNTGIKQFRWYQRELGVAEIQQNAYNICLTPASETGLVCYIPVTEGTDAVINDKITGNVSTLTGNGTASWQNYQAPLYPKHQFATSYAYNSFNQMLNQHTPDGGTSTFWYDILGRLVASQNSEQLAPKNTLNSSAKRYSYTKYDAIGRIAEAGEKYSGTELMPHDDDVIPIGALDTKKSTELNTWYASGNDRQVTITIYDQPNTGIVTHATVTNLQTTNSRKRVVASIYKELKTNSYYDFATHYVYDINGNVKTLFQELTPLKNVEGTTAAGLRQINYDYDLISGKVNKVIYQPGKGDQFLYRYDYDADNRLTDAYSSRNGLQWQKDAHYYYYLHGPLARVELGKYQVQGVDYAYTLQGWLKGINSQSLDVTKDMAGDGNPAGTTFKKFGRDVYGYSLGYFNNDYKPIGGVTASAFDKTFNAPTAATGGNTGSQLFNGNISNTTVALNKINNGQIVGYSYLYDQLNRLLGMRQHNISGTNWNYTSYNQAYEEKLSYDANGNIKTLLRKGANAGGQPLAMDNLKYFYYYTNTSNARAEYDPTAMLPGDVKSLTNQLAHINDSDPAANYMDDIDNQSAGNYDYDNTGNLIKDTKEGITGIDWTVYGKIRQIKKGGTTINYAYDPSGNRVSKEVTGGPDGTTKEFYIRDAQGNTMAIYNSKATYVDWAEQHLYGSSRLGIWNYGKANPAAPGAVVYDSMMVGSTTYELTNHLGNVLSTISDKKIGISAGKTTVDYYHAVVLNQDDYYSGGMRMPKRTSDSLLFLSTFDAGTDGWAIYNTGTISNDNGRLKFSGNQVWSTLKKNLQLETGKQYRVRFTIDMGNCHDLHVPVYKSDITSYEVISGIGISITASGTYEGTFTATSNSMLLIFEMIPGANPPPDSTGYYWLDDVSVEKIGQLDSAGVDYRYAFNGQEKSTEINSSGNLYTAEFWEYDSRIGRRWNVDPLASKMPSWSPYSAFFNNPLRFTDPTGMAPDDWYYWMSSEGKLNKREVKNSTNNVYLMNYDERDPSNDKYVLINKFNPKSKGNNLLMIAFVGDLIKNAGGSSLTKEYGFSPNYPNKEALAYSRSALGQIFLNTNRKMSSDYYDLLNSVSHEVGHLKLKDNTLREHAGVYLYGFKDPSFSQSTDDHKIGTVRSFANYLYNIYDRENNSASIETINPLLDKFKELNTGISISYDFSGPTNRGGLNLYVNGSLVDYKPINEKTHKE